MRHNLAAVPEEAERYAIMPARADHVGLLSERLRAGDVAEVEAAGIGVRRAVWKSFRGSFYARTAFVDGEIAAMWGLGGSPFGKIAQPWLLTAPPIERLPLTFVRIGRLEVGFMLSLCSELRGYVDSSYARALRLLTVFGFDLSEEFPFGPNRAPFRMYSTRRR